VVLTVNYDSLRLTAHVVDGDSTPEQSDVVDVTATTDRPDSPVFPLLDDGSLTNLPDPYGFNTVTFCNEDPIAGVCRCGPRDVPAISYDIVMGDGIYTRDPSLTPPPLVVERDCIAENAHRTLFNFQPGIPLSVSLRATDRIGNVSETSATVTPSAATVSCSGDACGCCLLVNPDATACAGLPGLPSPDFPDGLCRAF
jgi:hypothetical protein